MSAVRQYAVLQRDAVSPTAEQLKRAFRLFHNLTDADAVRLASSASGILVRHENHDAARALLQAVQAEGINAVLVAEDQLPVLPEAKTLHRLEMSSPSLMLFDVLGHRTTLPWTDLELIVAGTVRQLEFSRTRTERTELRFSPVTGVWPRIVEETGTKSQSQWHLVLELFASGATTRYQIDAGRFPFNAVMDQPLLSLGEKFGWLVGEICRRTPWAVLNRGARSLQAGHAVTEYLNRQMLTDEVTWLLWHTQQQKRAGRA
ncbi:MAG: hypothetical protein KIS67_16475 [Verrucomicrobiae bacterium]|nr:hypothetical protein [Verrucomicrobiae bacterium]